MHASDQSPEEGVGSHRVEITGGCELPDTGAGNPILVLCKSREWS